ncbi:MULTISPECIES: SDR family NAD(P)-dependent oxidoreductase [Actinomadura]|uniref:SDR family oxidoreductase n=1 Tax=Actinomadura geliboluensis TaxID=882440 RepID=A0A5S4G0N5_9ACTN|nr:SDR family oxidoreductase [Actinomadura geliboluensis]TMR26509.1 SDR family oxidoreductase [Actinomadura geliboluensis]
MSGRFEGRVALVTGASSGIGAGVARRLAGEGARVLLVARDARRTAAAHEDLLADSGRGHRVFEAELEDAGSIRALAASVGEAAGRLDVLVQSAGVFGPRPFQDISVAELDRMWAVNARAPFLVAQALTPLMGEGSSMVLVSSVSGHVGMAGQAAYGMTKSAVDGLARTLAVELAPRGVRVNAVAPGFTATPMNEHLRAEPGRVERLESATLAGRLGTVDDIARAIAYLASDDAAFVVGTTLTVDGGYPTSHIQTGRVR